MSACVFVCLSVSLSVCLSIRITQKQCGLTAELDQILCILLVAVARSSSDGIAISYVSTSGFEIDLFHFVRISKSLKLVISKFIRPICHF